MAWTDAPTPSQVETLSRWMEWHLSYDECRKAMFWLKEHANRREVSEEMGRVRKLYLEHKLDKKECFNSSIWKDYDPDKYEAPPKPKARLEAEEFVARIRAKMENNKK